MKFSVRDLLWLTVVVALAVGWWVERRRLNAEIDFLHLEIVNIKGSGFQRIQYLPNSSAPAPNPPKD